MKQKIEGGKKTLVIEDDGTKHIEYLPDYSELLPNEDTLEERFKKKFYYVPKNDEEATYCDPLHIRTIIPFIQAEIEKAKASERQRCVDIIVDYFAGAGELWFPYIGVGAETKEEEKECAKNELEDLIEAISQAKHNLEQMK